MILLHKANPYLLVAVPDHHYNMVAGLVFAQIAP